MLKSLEFLGVADRVERQIIGDGMGKSSIPIIVVIAVYS